MKAVQWRWCRQVRGTFEGWEEGAGTKIWGRWVFKGIMRTLGQDY